MDGLYSFVYRGVLTEASLDKVGRQRRRYLRSDEASQIVQTLSYDLLDQDRLAEAQRMAIVYTAIHAFENMVRAFVMKAMIEVHKENWWNKVPDRIQKKVRGRMDEAAKFRWHTARGDAEIEYADFGDLASIIQTNWAVFEDVLSNLEWAKQLLDTLERPRYIVMHRGSLANEDIERIGMNIRDWVRQAG